MKRSFIILFIIPRAPSIYIYTVTTPIFVLSPLNHQLNCLYNGTQSLLVNTIKKSLQKEVPSKHDFITMGARDRYAMHPSNIISNIFLLCLSVLPLRCQELGQVEMRSRFLLQLVKRIIFKKSVQNGPSVQNL